DRERIAIVLSGPTGESESIRERSRIVLRGLLVEEVRSLASRIFEVPVESLPAAIPIAPSAEHEDRSSLFALLVCGEQCFAPYGPPGTSGLFARAIPAVRDRKHYKVVEANSVATSNRESEYRERFADTVPEKWSGSGPWWISLVTEVVPYDDGP